MNRKKICAVKITIGCCIDTRKSQGISNQTRERITRRQLPRQGRHSRSQLRTIRSHQSVAQTQSFRTGDHTGATELFQQADKALISTNPAAPQDDPLHTPATDLGGVSHQAGAIDATAQLDLPRCPVGHQVQLSTGGFP